MLAACEVVGLFRLRRRLLVLFVDQLDQLVFFHAVRLALGVDSETVHALLKAVVVVRLGLRFLTGPSGAKYFVDLFVILAHVLHVLVRCNDAFMFNFFLFLGDPHFKLPLLALEGSGRYFVVLELLLQFGLLLFFSKL